MRILGVDLGAKRVGLALADTQSGFCWPLTTLIRGGRDKFFADLVRLARENEAGGIVVGLPLALDGSETLSSRQARNVADSLRRRIDVPVSLVNEALSTEQAKDELAQAGRKGGKLAAALDQQAAVLILQTYLREIRTSQ